MNRRSLRRPERHTPADPPYPRTQLSVDAGFDDVEPFHSADERAAAYKKATGAPSNLQMGAFGLAKGIGGAARQSR